MAEATTAEHHGIRDEIAHLAVPIGDLQPYQGNPRIGSIEEIKASLKANGQYRPVVVNRGSHTERPGEILAGNHTFKAAADLGWTHIAATWVDVDDQEARRIVLVDNRTNDMAGYDDLALVEVIRDVIEAEGPVGLEGTGYHPDDLDALAQIAYAAGDGDAIDDGGGGGTVEKPWPHTCDGSETVTVYVGDCIERMNEMEANSVDSVVTDPPYAFDMEGWDHYEPAAYQQWCEEWAAAALRVVKPGAHMIVIGGARTHHRMMAGVEDAGWEIRDFGVWLYRCLSDDTEILTAEGWKRGIDVVAGEEVAQWDANTGRISLGPVQEVHRGRYRGDLIRFHNDDTDQLVTPNHRVFHRHSQRQQIDGVRTASWPSDWTVAEARDINRWQSIQLPLAGQHDGGEGIGGLDYAALLGWVWTEGHFDAGGNAGLAVRIYQSSANPGYVDEIAALCDRIGPHKRYDRDRSEYKGRDYVESQWFFSGEIATRIRNDLPGKQPAYALLWRMTADEKEQFLDAALKGDGSCSNGRYTFYQRSDADRDWFSTLLALTGRAGTDNPSKKAVSIKQSMTTNLQHRHLSGFESVPYDGEVWCVTVPTGAFVARRNGRIFITGNSGWPKGTDVSVSLDDQAGVERTDRRTEPRKNVNVYGPGRGVTQKGTPVSEQARKWHGWSTALKPSIEPWVIARKPLEADTLVDNLQRWGTGAINVAAVRHDPDDQWARQERLMGVFGIDAEEGRWPANVLTDEPDEDLRHFRLGAHLADFRKASASERPQAKTSWSADHRGDEDDDEEPSHPTIKPIELCRHFVRLATPPGGVVLDPFAGSGTTAEAAIIDGFHCVMTERDESYLPLIRRRIERTGSADQLTVHQQ